MSDSETSVAPPGSLSPQPDALGLWWKDEPDPKITEGDKFYAASENMEAASEKELEAKKLALETQKLRIFGGRQLKAGEALLKNGLTIKTDLDLHATELQWIVKNVIPDAGIGTIYGDSGTFKSFVALDLMAAIAGGDERWFGYRVKRVPCVYVPFEGKGGVPKRVAAWNLARTLEQRPTDPNAPVFPINLAHTGISFIMDQINLRNVEDRKTLVEFLKLYGLAGGVLCIDTLAQAGHGIDENSSEGMGEMISIFQELQSELGGVVLVIHHTGKVTSKGMRGHSSLRGALDFSIECSRPDGAGKYEALMVLDKVKDEESGAVIPFAMRRVTLGVDEDDDHITSLVVARNEPNPNMPECERPADADVQARLNTQLDEFVWQWIKRENSEDRHPSARSLTAKLNEMRAQNKNISKREHIRDAVERLITTGRLSQEKHMGNRPWLRAVDLMTTSTQGPTK